MFFKRPRHRIFEYIPRFYNPESDEKERKKRKLGFQRQRKIQRNKRSPIFWLLIIVLVVYIYLKLIRLV